MAPSITLWFLQASRSIRIAWLLEELHQDYNLKFFDRMSNMKAPDEFKSGCGNALGKAPSLQDGDVTVFESGAITEYLCEKYDEENRLMPRDAKERVKVLQWIHASEATFMLHALAITYARWNVPAHCKDNGDLAAMEKGMSANVQNDLEWLESELSASKGGFLCGDKVTAADTMMQFSLEFIMGTNLGTQGKEWPAINKWLEKCRACEGYRKAVEKTGHRL
ncbi:glutathione S-transferase [Pleomassaria siparia CBS 279.74]|uniref:Glutathione S-transferase n=1 Tax=Pleomassaria siparia CBS 279.74 TaxID=1314801 RepID=A0A6G1KA99_9PLEO|nr:glutathione S-transferase [Pleomassaria siparia CBS 279.74]